MKIKALLLTLCMASASANASMLDIGTMTGSFPGPLVDISGITVTFELGGGGGGPNSTTYLTDALTLGPGDKAHVTIPETVDPSVDIIIYDLDTPLTAEPRLEEATITGVSSTVATGVDFEFPNADAILGTPNSAFAVPVVADGGNITIESTGGGGLFAFQVQYQPVPEPSAGLLALLGLPLLRRFRRR